MASRISRCRLTSSVATYGLCRAIGAELDLERGPARLAQTLARPVGEGLDAAVEIGVAR